VSGDGHLPDAFGTRRLVLRGAEIAALLGVLVLVVLLAPGLGEVRRHLDDAAPGWVAIAVALEALSGASYILMFRPIFCPRMSWRTSTEISWAELGVGSLVPASGAGGLALGAWVLGRTGMPADKIARRSVAFFLLKSSVNFVAVAVLGTLMAIGVLGPDEPLWLTAGAAVLSVLAMAVVVGLPRLGSGAPPPFGAGRVRRGVAAARRAVVDGAREAEHAVRGGNLLLLAGIVGYWAWDNAVLWAAFRAFGAAPPLTVVLMGYLIGQLGGLLPLPGGVGGIDGGLIGSLIVFGAPAADTAAAVLVYRVILFWLPLLGGALAYASLRRELARGVRADLCT
jgi:uncharacterized membrane protein YbhN (UPF0104 family)